MRSWPRYPVIYEINAWVWLEELSREYKSPVTLAKVLGEKLDSIANLKPQSLNPRIERIPFESMISGPCGEPE